MDGGDDQRIGGRVEWGRGEWVSPKAVDMSDRSVMSVSKYLFICSSNNTLAMTSDFQ